MVHDVEDVTAIVLAGGVGSRLRAVVSDRPKPLAEVAGRTFLSYVLDQITVARVARAVFSTGFMAASIREAFGEAYASTSLSYAEESAPLGTGGGLRLAATLATTETLLVFNGDSFCDVALGDFLGDYRAHGGTPSIVLARQLDTSRFGRVDCDATGTIRAFREKGGDSGPGWINAGVYALPRRLVMALADDRPLSLEREVFPDWVKTGLRGYPSEAAFLDIGMPESYARAAAFFALRAARPHGPTETRHGPHD